ncbi:hypothetical protein EV207_1465 [Scopulibacillus darangshiensis]|uniref:Uncharacterized protein n=1 Tax=Scopulibacillus darangshiensis TaxID=442528 RepID=A0A4R2NIM7_9BACL|nr:hypothetical protein EV207_1465 [Scopulibacillus darangshiensis]
MGAHDIIKIIENNSRWFKAKKNISINAKISYEGQILSLI